VFAPWDKGLDRVTEVERLEVLYWLHKARRDLDCLDGTPLIDLKPDRSLFAPLASAQAGDFQVGDS
jgi:tRNA (Thr-GGU) A37 N-methylase